MMITDRSKRVIPFRAHDAKRVGDGCFYLDLIVWLNGDRIELGDRVGFNYGCYVNGYGGLRIGDRTIIGRVGGEGGLERRGLVAGVGRLHVAGRATR